MGVPNLIVVYDAQCYLEILFPSDLSSEILLLISKEAMKKSIPEMNLPMTTSTFLMLRYLFNLVAQDIIVYQ